MPAVFVHGVPDTQRLWDGVLSYLSRKDTVTLSLPGFGVEAPAGFGSTKEEYADWLIGELEAIGEPVDLVGHDWGAFLVGRAVCLRPDLVRTWAAGGVALDEEYDWHPVAKMWQTPGLGEQVMQAMTAEAMAQAYVDNGVPEELAREFSSRVDERMKGAILSLYRSAVEVCKEWAPAIDGIERPGLVLWGKDDPFAETRFAERMAKRTGARLVVLEGTGHWWPAQRPEEVAAALEGLWGDG
jgi:pimeloyl-ACP methyl ester carboxylesterase